ncbi:MAG: hypothetical protein MZW92_11560 [Comamonadaceae bacterium]|nr:hypothetical protein [Comamonadaceae bacterium]
MPTSFRSATTTSVGDPATAVAGCHPDQRHRLSATVDVPVPVGAPADNNSATIEPVRLLGGADRHRAAGRQRQHGRFDARSAPRTRAVIDHPGWSDEQHGERCAGRGHRRRHERATITQTAATRRRVHGDANAVGCDYGYHYPDRGPNNAAAVTQSHFPGVSGRRHADRRQQPGLRNADRLGHERCARTTSDWLRQLATVRQDGHRPTPASCRRSRPATQATVFQDGAGSAAPTCSRTQTATTKARPWIQSKVSGSSRPNVQQAGQRIQQPSSHAIGQRRDRHPARCRQPGRR